MYDRQRMSRFPFSANPTGWYQVAYSDELPAGAVRPLTALGRDRVAYRGAGGAVHVLDAYCPHLGAHLGHGGTVVDDRIRCPFHGWCFDGQGACVEIPRVDKIPPRARLPVCQVRETAGMILVHHDPTGAPPGWEPALPALEDERWVPAYDRRAWRIRSHPQDIVENLVDAAHFLVVHRTATLPAVEVDPAGHTFRARSRMGLQTPRGLVEETLYVAGQGRGVSPIRFPGIVDLLLVLCVTPVEGQEVDLRLSFRVARDASAERGVGAALTGDIVRQTEEDIRIWEHKIYRDRPVLGALDRPVAALRSWARQFYPAE
jgi:nitrite reductase/ring-hydroxylating ferredoxin subunit